MKRLSVDGDKRRIEENIVVVPLVCAREIVDARETCLISVIERGLANWTNLFASRMAKH